MSNVSLTKLHCLQKGDVFEFITDRMEAEQTPPLRPGRLVVSVRPWGAKNAATGPVAPWMFACRDVEGRTHHYVLSPHLEVRLIHTTAAC